MSVQEDRRYRLQLQTGAGQALVWETNEDDPSSSLRVTFRIEKHIEPNPNPATISIYGLDLETAKRIQELRGMTVRLEAGYKERRTEIFVGQLYQGFTSREGNTWKTELRSLDGGTTWHTKRLALTVQTKTTLHDAIRTAIEQASGRDPQTGSKVRGTVIRILKDVPNIEFPDGLTMHGPLKDVLSKFCNGTSLGWSIQDDEIQIFAEGGDTGEEVVVLAGPKNDEDAGTGLIGSPGRSIETIGIFLKTSITFTALFDGRLRPGRRVKLESRTASGLYTIQRATFEGDTHGTPWYVQCQSYT